MSRSRIPPPPTRYGVAVQAKPALPTRPGVVQPAAQGLGRGRLLPVAPPTPGGRYVPLGGAPFPRTVQMSSESSSALKSGTEAGTNWVWVGSLDLTYQGVNVPAHPIHEKHVAAMGGNTFYGSFTIIFMNNTHRHYWEFIQANPTRTDHTEPQYFQWLDQHLRMFCLTHAAGTVFGDDGLQIKAIIMEMAQTNTPCSKVTCRKEILRRVSAGLWGDVAYLARLSAYQMYEAQPPSVSLTYSAAKTIARSGESAVLSEPGVVHKVPEMHTK